MTDKYFERWLETRKRIQKSVDAVFWQDLNIDDPEKRESIDWILDEIFKPEVLALLEDQWSVWRQDDNGNHFEVESCLPYDEAKLLVKRYETKGHKQYYWFKPSGLKL